MDGPTTARAVTHARAQASPEGAAAPAAVALPQDVLVVTAPGSGAEVIPFLKTLDLPMAVLFTVAYTTVRAGAGFAQTHTPAAAIHQG